jgi:hypothetical protein
VFAGSKRAARARANDDAEVARVQRELREIHALAPYIRDEAALQAVLAEVAGPEDRAAVEALLRRFVRFPPEPPC